MICVSNFLSGSDTLSAHAQNRSWHSLPVEPFTELEIGSKQTGGDWHHIHLGVDCPLEGEHASAVTKSKHSNWHAIFEDHFLIGAWSRISYNLLVALSTSGDCCESNRGEVESVKERGIVKVAEAKRLLD